MVEQDTKAPWRRPILQWLFFWLNGDIDGRCFMCATPCTLNLLQVRSIGKRKHHLQQFQSKFEVEKQGPWNKLKTKKSHIDFDPRRLGLGKSKLMVLESQL
jgi:hypothetical protein